MKTATCSRQACSALAIIAVVASLTACVSAPTGDREAREAPRFEVDPTWPKLPPRYIFGQVSSVSIDEQGHAWVLGAPPSSLHADQKDKAAPPVIEFDEQGNFVQPSGGPGQGLRLAGGRARHLCRPEGLCLDRRQRPDRPSDGEVQQGRQVRDADRPQGREQRQQRYGECEGPPTCSSIRRPTSSSSPTATATGASSSSTPTPARSSACGAHSATCRSTRSRRAESPAGAAHPRKGRNGPGPDQFSTPVHAARVSTTVSSTSPIAGASAFRSSRSRASSSSRIRRPLVRSAACGNGQTVASTAFSHDPEQRFLYVASGSPARLLGPRPQDTPTARFVRTPRRQPGEFYVLHHMNVDTKGNLYVTEVQDGKRPRSSSSRAR